MQLHFARSIFIDFVPVFQQKAIASLTINQTTFVNENKKEYFL
jgi:hypothetical protein